MEEWATWVTVLHLPEELYWESTPREIHACFDAFLTQQDIEQRRFGTVAAWVVNVHRKNEKGKLLKPLTWENFLPPFRQKQGKKRGKTLDEMQAEAKLAIKDWYRE